MSSGFPTKSNSNQPSELQRLARKLNDCARSKSRCATFQLVNNKGADQPARKCRLDCALYVRKPLRHVFSRRGPKHRISKDTCIRLYFFLKFSVRIIA